MMKLVAVILLWIDVFMLSDIFLFHAFFYIFNLWDYRTAFYYPSIFSVFTFYSSADIEDRIYNLFPIFPPCPLILKGLRIDTHAAPSTTQNQNQPSVSLMHRTKSGTARNESIRAFDRTGNFFSYPIFFLIYWYFRSILFQRITGSEVTQLLLSDK